MSASKTLQVKSYLRTYKVSFSEDCFSDIGAIAGRAKCFFVVDASIARVYQKELKPVMDPQRVFVVKAVESNKSLKTVQNIIDFLISHNFKRNDCLVAIGGGIIEDVAGFTSSILFRGIEWVFCPTTLLAQADSCIGSKNCINAGMFKNQLGTFYPPAEVILDTVFLKSLARKDICSGLGEIIKFFILDGRESLDFISTSYARAFQDDDLMRRLIRRSLAIKKKTIETDEFDRGIRNMFNYGHTFGHAIESLTKYRMSHGRAITIGMGLANYIAWQLGHLSRNDYELMRPVIENNSPAFHLPAQQEQAYMLNLSKDKKNMGKELTCILLKSPGKAFKAALAFDQRLRSLIREYFSR